VSREARSSGGRVTAESDLKAAAFPRLDESQMAAQFVHEFLRESAIESRTAPADRQPQPAGANA
jgi:hypothetical protein